MKLFLDANVLFSAAYSPNGKAALVIELRGLGGWSIATSAYAREESLRNLHRKAPHALDRFHAILTQVDVVDHRPDLAWPSALVEKDRPIFQAALGCGATHLLTGDIRHFGPLMNQPEATGGVLVQTVAEFLDSIGI